MSLPVRNPGRANSEQARLMPAVMVNSPSRLLLLDEPDVVEEALRAYRGTLVMVTYDAWFARAVGHRRRWRSAPAASWTLPHAPPSTME
jgi:ATPase subunit of ABC transporter with duplicated ATPase domains